VICRLRWKASAVQAMLRPVRTVSLHGATVLVAASLFALPQAPVAGGFAQLSQQADQARDAEDLDQAIRLYQQALALRPQWAEGWWSLGTIYYDRDAYRDAARAFQRLIALNPKNGTAHAMLGLCQFELGQDEPALRNIQAARQLGIRKNDELHRVVLYHEGLLFLRKHKFSSAQQALTLLASEGVQEKNAALALGMSVLLVHPSKLPPEGSLGSEVVLHVGQAEVLGAAKQIDEAKKLYNSAIEEAANFPNLHYAYGRFLLEAHETDPAVAQFQREIQNNPRHVQAHLEIAAVCYRIDSADGVKYAEQAVRIDPSLPFGHYLLGLLYLDTNNFAKAIMELEIAKRSFPKEAKIYFALGNAYARAGRKQDAARARATFARLNSEEKQAAGPAIYGQQSSGTDQQKLGPEPDTKPQ
jgi:tetratricopeptide (TPR) repeat protein